MRCAPAILFLEELESCRMKGDHCCGPGVVRDWVALAVRAGGSLSSLPLRSSSDMRPCRADAGDVSDLTRRLSPDVGRDGGVEGGLDIACSAQQKSMVLRCRRRFRRAGLG